MTQEGATVLWNKFFVLVLGNTIGAHHDFVIKLKGVGHSEVNSPEECDYLLAFCPVASRVGTDISEALNKIPAGKPTILVVMHHTFDPDHVVAESRRLVTHKNVHLTVDCLFYEDHFLDSNCNDTALLEVQKHLGASVSEDSTGQAYMNKTRSKYTEVCSHEHDYVMVTVAEEEVLERTSDGKPTNLVATHHTFDPDHVVAESRRPMVTHPEAGCLSYDDPLLDRKIPDTTCQKFLGDSQVSNCQKWKLYILIFLVLVAVVILAIIVAFKRSQ